MGEWRAYARCSPFLPPWHLVCYTSYVPIAEARIKMRLDIRKEQVETKDVLMCKLRC